MCVYSKITERIFYAPARACSFVCRACCCLITLSLLLFLFRLDRICLLLLMECVVVLPFTCILCCSSRSNCTISGPLSSVGVGVEPAPVTE